MTRSGLVGLHGLLLLGQCRLLGLELADLVEELVELAIDHGLLALERTLSDHL